MEVLSIGDTHAVWKEHNDWLPVPQPGQRIVLSIRDPTGPEFLISFLGNVQNWTVEKESSDRWKTLIRGVLPHPERPASRKKGNTARVEASLISEGQAPTTESVGKKKDRASRGTRTRGSKIGLVRALQGGFADGPVLAIGLDVTWWGGSRSVDSASEVVAIARREGETWSLPTFHRVNLADGMLTPSASGRDPNGSRLVEYLAALIEQDLAADMNVVIAIDAPLLARARPELPHRSKKPKKGELAFRDCEVEAREVYRFSRPGWRLGGVQPGAPLPPRIELLRDALCARLGLTIYRSPKAVSASRTLLETFPNDSVWGAGIVQPLPVPGSHEAATAYKRLKKCSKTRPVEAVRTLTAWAVVPVLDASGLTHHEAVRWTDSLWAWLSTENHFSLREGVVRIDKRFDDAVDSLLALAASVAFIEGRAHVHVADDATDGHIVGVGMFGAEKP